MFERIWNVLTMYQPDMLRHVINVMPTDTALFLACALLGLMIVTLIELFIVRMIAQGEDGDLFNGFDGIDCAMVIIILITGATWIGLGITYLHLDDRWPAYVLFISLVQFGGIIYRIRGGWLGMFIPGGTTPVRSIWSASAVLLIIFLLQQMTPELREQGIHINTVDTYVVGVFTFVLCYFFMLTPHGRQMDLGRANGDALEDAWHLACIGTARLLSIITPLAVFDPRLLWVAWFGVFHPLSYVIGWAAMIPAEWERPSDGGRADRYPIDSPTAWGEYLWGKIQTYGIIMVFGLSGYQISMLGVTLF